MKANRSCRCNASSWLLHFFPFAPPIRPIRCRIVHQGLNLLIDYPIISISLSHSLDAHLPLYAKALDNQFCAEGLRRKPATSARKTSRFWVSKWKPKSSFSRHFGEIFVFAFWIWQKKSDERSFSLSAIAVKEAEKSECEITNWPFFSPLFFDDTKRSHFLSLYSKCTPCQAARRQIR